MSEPRPIDPPALTEEARPADVPLSALAAFRGRLMRAGWRARVRAEVAERLRSLSRLQAALLISALLHLLLITLRLVDPQGFDRLFQQQPLEVTLVNARSDTAPTQAQAIAQVNLAGGGEADAGRATSPLPAEAVTLDGDAAQEAQARIEQLRQQQMELLSTVRRELAKLPPPDPQRDAQRPEARAEQERRRQLLDMLAEIEKRVNVANARPKRRYVSPATREAAYALYYDKLRRRIEERGTQHFPRENGQRLYGALTMEVIIDAQGGVLQTEVLQGSGNKTLDRRAQAIVQAAAPFGAFTPEMRKQVDQIVVVSRFSFSRDEGLATQLLQSSNP